VRLVASHQPVFLAWEGWWNKVLHARNLVVPLSLSAEGRDERFSRRAQLPNNGWCRLENDGPLGTYATAKTTDDSRAKAVKTLTQVYGSKQRKYRDRIEPILQSTAWHVPQLQLMCTMLNYNVCAALGVKVTVTTLGYVSPGLTKTSRLFDRVGQVYGAPYGYVAGQGTLSYLDKAEVPKNVDVLVQKPLRALRQECILGILVDEPDPVDVIMSAAEIVSWVP